jgi:hypothetical protein
LNRALVELANDVAKRLFPISRGYTIESRFALHYSPTDPPSHHSRYGVRIGYVIELAQFLGKEVGCKPAIIHLVLPPQCPQDTEELIIPHGLFLRSLDGISTLDTTEYLIVMVALTG